MEGVQMKESIGQERRRSKRVGLPVRIECKTVSRFILGRCENVSETGILINSRETFDSRREVSIRFGLPPRATGPAVSAAGIVVRVEPGKAMALKFANMSAGCRTCLTQYIQQTEESGPVPV